MTPFPPLRGGFLPWGSRLLLPLWGLMVSVLGVVVGVGYRPTGSSKTREVNPLFGAPPQALTILTKLGLINLSL